MSITLNKTTVTPPPPHRLLGPKQSFYSLDVGWGSRCAWIPTMCPQAILTRLSGDYSRKTTVKESYQVPGEMTHTHTL